MESAGKMGVTGRSDGWRPILAGLARITVAILASTAVGAALGLGVAWAVVAEPLRPNKDDWSGLLYVLFPAWGGAAGVFIGLVIGLAWALMSPSGRRGRPSERGRRRIG